MRDKARTQLGTVGSGNHYVDVFADETGAIWVGVHFGSRGLGYTIASGFLALSQGAKWGTRVPEREVLLPLDQPLGHDYWALMTLAGEYAYAGREWVARKAMSILGGRELELVHNHHNFAWREEHDGRSLIVIRKGATPAFPGQRGFVGGSMGDDAVIVVGTSPATTERRPFSARRSTRPCTGRDVSCHAPPPRGRRTGAPVRHDSRERAEAESGAPVAASGRASPATVCRQRGASTPPWRWSAVSRACGLSRVTITKGLQEREELPLPAGRMRRPGGGRPALVVYDPDLPSRLEALVEPLTRGDPESPLRWTSKSTRALSAELAAQHRPVSREKVAQLLRQMDCSLQGNRKTEEGSDHPDRDAQFACINQRVRTALAARRPVISVDTKKKEILGNYHNVGRQCRPILVRDRITG